MIEFTQTPLVLKQKRELAEILIGIEGRNSYELKDQDGKILLVLQEQGNGIWLWIKRNLFRAHRSLEIAVMSPTNGQTLATIQRPFYFFWSDIYLLDQGHKLLVQIHRRFALFKGKYDICDQSNNLIGNVEHPFLRLWSFKIFNRTGHEVGKISKQWGGILKEIFTDADTLALHFTQSVSKELMWGGFLTLVTVDFDYYEENAGTKSVLDFVTPD